VRRVGDCAWKGRDSWCEIVKDGDAAHLGWRFKVEEIVGFGSLDQLEISRYVCK